MRLLRERRSHECARVLQGSVHTSYPRHVPGLDTVR